MLAYLAGQAIELDAEELNGARRRALLLVAAGGDPHRELDVDDRAVAENRVIGMQNLLLERMPCRFGLVDLDAEAGSFGQRPMPLAQANGRRRDGVVPRH